MYGDSMKEDAILNPLQRIEEICTKAYDVIIAGRTLEDSGVSTSDCLLNTKDKNIVLKVQSIKDRIEVLLSTVETESLSPHIAGICRFLKDISLSYPDSSFVQCIDSVSVVADHTDALLREEGEMKSKIALIIGEKRKLEETALILADRMKFERHSSESRYSELLAQFHNQTETIESMKLQLEAAQRDFMGASKSPVTDEDVLDDMLSKTSKLEISLADSRKECDDLSRAKIVSDEQLRQLGIRYEDKETTIKSQYAQIQEMETTIELQCTQIEELRATCDSLQQMCISWQEYSQKSEVERDSIAQLDTCKLDLAAAEQRAREATEQVVDLRKLVAELENERDVLEDNLQRAKLLINQLSADVDAARGSSQEEVLLSELQSLGREVDDMQNQMSAYATSLAMAEKEKAELQDQLDQTEKLTMVLRSELTAVRSRLEKSCDKDRDAMAAMSVTVRALEAEKATLREDLVASQLLISSLSNDVRSATEALSEQRLRLSSTEEAWKRAAGELESDKTNLEKERADLSAALADSRALTDKLSSELQTTKVLLAEYKRKESADVQVLPSTVRALEAEKATLREDLVAAQLLISSLSTDLHAAAKGREEEKSRAASAVRTLESEAVALKKELVDAQSLISSLSSDLRRTNEDLTKFRGVGQAESLSCEPSTADAKGVIEDLEMKRSVLEQELANTKLSISKLTAEFEHATGRIRDSDEIIAQQKAEIATLKDKLNESESDSKEVNRLRHEIETLEERLRSNQTVVDNLADDLEKGRIMSAEAEVALREECVAARREKEELEVQLRKHTEALESLGEKHTAAEESVANMIEELVQVRAQAAQSVGAMKDALEQAKRETASLTEAILCAEKSLADRLEESEQLRDLVEKLEVERKDAEETVTAMTNEAFATKSVHAELLKSSQSAMDSMRKDMGILQQQLSLAEAKIAELTLETKEKDGNEAGVVVNLYASVTELRRENSSLEEQLRTNKASMSSLVEELEASKAVSSEVGLLRSVLEGSQSETAALEKELKALQERAQDAQSQGQGEVIALQAIVDRLQLEKEELERELRELSASERAAEERESDEVVELRFTVGDLLRDKSGLEDRLEVVQSEAANLIEQVALYQPFESECMYLQSSIDTLTTEKTRLEEELRSQSDVVQREKERLMEQLAASETVKKSILEQVDLLKSSLEASLKEKISLEDQLCGAQSLIRSLVQQVDEKTAMASDETRIEDLRLELSRANDSLSLAERDLEEAQAELEEAQGEELRLHAVVKESKDIEQALKDTNNALQEHIRDIEQKLQGETKLRGVAETLAEQLRVQALEATDQLDQLRVALTDKDSRLLAQENELRALQKEVAKRQASNPTSGHVVGNSTSKTVTGSASVSVVTAEPSSPASAAKPSEVIKAPLRLLEKTLGTAMSMSAYFQSPNQPPAPASTRIEASVHTSQSQARLPSTGDDQNSSDTQLYVEIGAFEIRIGVWSRVTLSLDTCYICPAIVASAKVDESIDDLIFNGEVESEKAINLYKQEGILVGREAFFCAYNHSDWRIREGLEISYPLVQGRVRNSHGFLFLVRHALECAAEAAGLKDLHSTRVVLSHKPTWVDQDLYLLADALFAQNHCGPVIFLSECALALEASGLRSALVLDIGASSSYAVVVHKGIVLQESLKITSVGGEHVTEFLCALVEAQSSDESNAFARQLPRRRVQIARQLKEDYGFVASDFHESTSSYGRKSLEQCRRLLCASRDRERDSSIDYKACRPDDIRCGEEFALPDGSAVSVALDCERFYGTEVLFSPTVLASCQHSPGLAKVMVDAASTVDSRLRQEVLCNVLVTGRSALLAGIASRLEVDLTTPLRRLGVSTVSVRVAEGVDWPPSAAWSGVTAWLRSQDSLSKEPGGKLLGEPLIQQRVVTARDYGDKGPSILSRSRLTSAAR